jgi:hypothetical protein
MNLVWVALAIAALGAIVKRVARWRARGSQSNLGSVSDQWVAEHRLANNNDSPR